MTKSQWVAWSKLMQRVNGASPRFKVGDLVHTTHGGVGRIAEVFDGASTFVSKTYVSRLCNAELTPYTLPPIKSYADLADVLDELPEGVVIEVEADRGSAPVHYRRRVYNGSTYYEAALKGQRWWESPAVAARDTLLLARTTSCRIVPPSEVEK